MALLSNEHQQTENHLLFNGQFVSQGGSAPSRGMLYGDGVFESMRIWQGRIPLFDLHFQRFQAAIRALGLEGNIERDYLEKQLISLAGRNACADNGRIRLSAWRSEGGLYLPLNNNMQWQAEALPLKQEALFDSTQQPVKVIIYQEAQLPLRGYQAIKHMGRLTSVQAMRAAQAAGCEDAMLLNNEGRIACATSANVFVYSDGVFFTPPATEGCLPGVMREALLKSHTKAGVTYAIGPVSVPLWQKAAFAVLTNAVNGLRWVPLNQKERPSALIGSLLAGIRQFAGVAE